MVAAFPKCWYVITSFFVTIFTHTHVVKSLLSLSLSLGAVYTQFGGEIIGENFGDRFGVSLDISDDGTTLVIGASNNDVNGLDAGQVSVYRYISSTNSYSKIGLDFYGKAALEFFGTSVSISADGSTLVVGAPQTNGNNTYYGPGRVRVYKINVAGTQYSQFGSDINGAVTGQYFGRAVDISADGTTFIVGSRNIAGSGADFGPAFGHVSVLQNKFIRK